MQIKTREINQSVYEDALSAGFSEITARIVAGRIDEFNSRVININRSNLTPASKLKDAKMAAERIIKAIKTKQKIVIFTDYDVDGATSMAVLYRAITQVFGVDPSLVTKMTGHRVTDGYGLTRGIAERILDIDPALVITADCASSDHESIKLLHEGGIDVIVTDHHLMPAEGIPEKAFAVVNPQREDCSYDGNICGCAVAWLLMTLVSQGLGCDPKQRRSIFELLDFVALATVSDMVKLNSPINRYFVKTGLQFMNDKERTCWAVALEDKEATVGTLGFQLGPRINAASRMSGYADPAIGFLTSDDHEEIEAYYAALCDYNDKRKKIEQDMAVTARKQSKKEDPCIIAYDPSFDPGVQGIVASNLVEKFGKPAVMLADVPGTDFVTGSCRGGQFLHVRDALQAVHDANDSFFESFGGHAAAAGLKFHKDKLGEFREQFAQAVESQLADTDTTPFIETDGSLEGMLNIRTHNEIQELAPYGLGFATPVFHDTFTVTSARMVGANPVHLKLELKSLATVESGSIGAIKFYAIQNADDPMPVQHGDRVEVLYQTDLNVWNGRESLQLIVKRIEKV